MKGSAFQGLVLLRKYGLAHDLNCSRLCKFVFWQPWSASLNSAVGAVHFGFVLFVALQRISSFFQTMEHKYKNTQNAYRLRKSFKRCIKRCETLKLMEGQNSLTSSYRFGNMKISPKFVAHSLTDELIFPRQ